MSIRKQYDTDLESLKNSLTEMGRNLCRCRGERSGSALRC